MSQVSCGGRKGFAGFAAALQSVSHNWNFKIVIIKSILTLLFLFHIK